MVGHTDSPAICVVGAGIVGASAALHLARLGATKVTVVDAGEPLAGTTPAGAGFVAAFAADTNRRLHPDCVPLETYGVDFYTDLDARGHDIDFSARGNLVLALTPEKYSWLQAGLLEHPARLPGTRAVTPEEINGLTSGAVNTDKVAGGVLMPEGIQVTTGKAVLAMLEELRAADADLRFSTAVTGILRDADGRVTGVTTTQGDISADVVILACGAWVNDLLTPLGQQLPLVPVVATRMVSADVGVPADLPTIQCPELGLWIRELHGAWSWGVGSAYRRASLLEGVDTSIGRPVAAELIEAQQAAQPQVAEVFPTLAGQAAVTTIQGMPVYSADGNLYAGAVPSAPGLFALSGDNESGVTHGPGMGRLVAEMVLGHEPFVSPTSFRLDRTDPADFVDEDAVVAVMAGDRVADALD
ncbi:NAD(P)/FAD-dependent oxidoreductase [Ornithinimicrobium cavernae]|uniref:NAD(P)/FAD-dependent oxidoreductase n=1 Tax=Ornithinimicrobium cavernae TaxID=2666047 RepID=UPI000D69F752|nr:FAD-binding oxidoreductase [Ornithinimicrobium cavernae]